MDQMISLNKKNEKILIETTRLRKKKLIEQTIYLAKLVLMFIIEKEVI